jgi:SAM-dependent methyltransferase
MVVTPEMILNDVYGAEMMGRDKFDFCFCDLSLNDLMNAQRLIDTIQHLLKPKSKIVLFHFGQPGSDLDWYAQQLAQGLFTFSKISAIHYTGSIAATVAAKTFMNAAKRFDFGFLGKIKMVLALVATAPVARLASFLEEQRGSQTYRPHCTSLTIEIESRQ